MVRGSEVTDLAVGCDLRIELHSPKVKYDSFNLDCKVDNLRVLIFINFTNSKNRFII